MAGAFEHATRVAIQELIESHAQTSKFGYVLSTDSFKDLTDALYDLLLTSRNLKSAGDRILGNTSAPQPPQKRVGALSAPPMRKR